MPTPKNARPSARGGRTYQLPSTGELFVSVTTAIGSLNKPALVAWAARSVAEGAVANISELQRRLEEEGPDATIRWLKGLPYSMRDTAADLGSAVHGAVEQLILGKPMKAWPKLAQGHQRQFTRFLDAYRPTFELAEETVWNRTAGYAGTLDFIASIGGRRLLIDVKTSPKGPWPEVALQLAAYQRAEFIALPDGKERPLPVCDGAAVLKLNADGYLLVDVDTSDRVYQSFLDALACYRWQNDLAPHVIREMVTPIALEAPTSDAAPSLEELLAVSA